MPGAAHLVMVDGVVHLDPVQSVFEAMLDGWVSQQRTRFLKDGTIRLRVDLVRRFGRFTNLYPWQWRAGEVEAFFDHLRSSRQERPIAMSTHLSDGLAHVHGLRDGRPLRLATGLP